MADLGEIMRGEGPRYLERHNVRPVQRRAIYDITGCRTAAMGAAVLTTCEDCSVEFWRYRSCRNRSCPLCQGETRANWLTARLEELLPVSYLHVVFNVPSEFRDLALYYPKELYEAVIRAAGQAVLEVGWSKVHALLGCLIQLQTWAQNLAFHLHTHCVVPCGGFSEDGSRWISFDPHDLPADELSARFRTLLCQAIRTAAEKGKFERWPKAISVDEILLTVSNREWKVYAEPPFGGPKQLLAYLARYTSRVAITNDRIVSYENHRVIFRGREYGDDKDKPYKLEGQEFVRRVVEHVPPKGFVRIRSYGIMANRNRKKNLERARQLIGETAKTNSTQRSPSQPSQPSQSFEPFRALRLCPACSERRRQERMGHFALQPDLTPQAQPAVSSQIALSLRPPPIRPVAA